MVRISGVTRRLSKKIRWIVIFVLTCVPFIILISSGGITMYDSSNKTVIQPGFHSDESSSSIKSRFTKRNHIVKEGCRTLKQYYIAQNSEAAVKEHLVVDRKKNIVYCAIEKIGCTFWKRIFQILSGWRNVSDPFSIKGIHAYEGYQTAKRLPFDKIHQILRQSKKFMFVREPFERLVSGYADKLYSPNAAYWNFIGRYIVANFRDKPTNLSLECGHDITFEEFVKYFIYSQNTNEHRDAHFVPSFEHCRPCEIEYDYIGKMETFKDDTFQIIQELNLQNVVKFTDFQNETDVDAIIDTVDYVYSMKRAIEKCMPLPMALFRSFRKLQIRGILSKNIKFPYDTSKQMEIPPLEYKRFLLKAHEKSGDAKLRKKNREEAFLEAYSKISTILLDRLKKTLLIDTVLFGYEELPKKITDLENKTPYNENFRFFTM
ncbi:carbohydrate sulfotransferase 14-like [Mytilus californianus]|uniref:carbohydrate sulfotransferase 14-like n=1 Tax=Mytilus californianus TaxID=6549 RepID=UPI0022479A95|nr:carbohydrate sulfotransferase 14-like [Mytilus californianus]